MSVLAGPRQDRPPKYPPNKFVEGNRCLHESASLFKILGAVWFSNRYL